MEFTGKLLNISKDWQTGQFQATFTVNESSAVQFADEIKDCEKLSIKAEKYRERRSYNANKLMWDCLDKIAKSMSPPEDKWTLYLSKLKAYGKYTYICVKPNAVEKMKLLWRETEVVGEIDINGEKAVQMLCYFGSSTFDTKEFSILLDGIIADMQNMGLQTPTTKEMQRALEQWEKMCKGR